MSQTYDRDFRGLPPGMSESRRGSAFTASGQNEEMPPYGSSSRKEDRRDGDSGDDMED